MKLSQVTNLSDARYAAGMGVQMIGFNINPDSQYYIDAVKFAEISGWVSGIDLVGEFDGEVFAIGAGYELDYIQISKPESIEIIKNLGKKVILQLNLSELGEEEAERIMESNHEEVDMFLLESTDSSFIPKVKAWAKTFPILLGYGISEENVLEILEKYAIKGISLLGSEEKVVGFKDYDHLSAILEVLMDED